MKMGFDKPRKDRTVVCVDCYGGLGDRRCCFRRAYIGYTVFNYMDLSTGDGVATISDKHLTVVNSIRRLGGFSIHEFALVSAVWYFNNLVGVNKNQPGGDMAFWQSVHLFDSVHVPC